jgi:alpha-D-ribose 1-methylphosphonate 5-triphosphate synthase subunit PhnH
MTAWTRVKLPDPVLSAQSTFRALMDATARPGSVRAIAGVASAPAPLSPGAAALALTLFDQDTPVWLDGMLSSASDVGNWIRFQTGAPITTDSSRSAFALAADPLHAPSFETFDHGTPEYPDRSTTLILQVHRFDAGAPLTLRGPGIRGAQRLCATPLPDDIQARLVANRKLFPCGIDLILVAESAVAALPRSVTLVGEAS